MISPTHPDACLAGGEYQPSTAPPKYALSPALFPYYSICEQRKQPRQEFEWTLPATESAECLPLAWRDWPGRNRPFAAVPYCDAARNHQTIVFFGDSTSQVK